MSSKTPFLNCENRIEDKNLRRMRGMARWKPEGWLGILKRVKKALRAKLCQANANPLSQERVVGFDHFDPGYPAGTADEIERHKLIILDQQNLLIIDPPHERCTRNSSSRLLGIFHSHHFHCG